jgi:hypothetical protein
MRFTQLASLLLLALAAAGAVAAVRITLPDEARLWTPAEFRLEGAPTAANNFDPDQIRLDAVITAPSGRTLNVPAFWTQDHTSQLVLGEEQVATVGDPGWRLRYTPTETGRHRLTLHVTLGGKPATEIARSEFDAAPAAAGTRPGWVGLAPDRRYLQTSDGRPLRLVGENVCWPIRRGTFDYVAWFDELQRSGQNFARLWMCPWSLALEQAPDSLTNYNLNAAWHLDRIFTLARERGIYLLLCLDFHGMYQNTNPHWGGSGNVWPKNPYQLSNGGPCVAPNDFFTDARARTLYQKRLRYLIARYGAHPNLLAWQFFNEIDNAYDTGPLKAADVADWHGAMGRWLKANDPFGHLVTTSLTGGSDRPEIWSQPEMDIAVYHSYGDPAPARKLATLTADFRQRYGKPVLIGEYGVDIWGWGRASDPYMRGLRQALWGGALGGSIGAATSWWWEEIHQDNAYPIFAALTGFLERAGWQQGVWTPARVEPVFTPPPPTVADQPADGEIYSNRIWLRVEPWFSEVRPVALTGQLAAERGAESLSSYLGPTNERYARRSIVLDGWWAGDAKLIFHINRAIGNVAPAVTIDGTAAWRTELPAAPDTPPGERKLDVEFSVPIPTGRHRVELANEMPVWLFVDSLRVQGLRPSSFADGWQFAPEPVALRQGQKAMVYVVSPHVVFPAGAQRYRPPVQHGQQVTLADWADGTYRIHWVDPETGAAVAATEATARDQHLTLVLPDFRVDLAALVEPR